MAKKDTYLALLRRGIDDTTANQLADAGLKIGDLKKIDKTMLVENYGLKEEIAQGVIEIITAGPQSHGKERFLSKVLAPEKKQNPALRKSSSSASKRTSDGTGRTEGTPQDRQGRGLSSPETHHEPSGQNR